MTDIERPVLIQYGQADIFEVASERVAQEVHPKATIVAWAGSFEPYEKGEKPAELTPAVQLALTPPISRVQSTPAEDTKTTKAKGKGKK